MFEVVLKEDKAVHGIHRHVHMQLSFTGHLNCFIWAQEHGCPWDASTSVLAAMGGQLNCLIWAREHWLRHDHGYILRGCKEWSLKLFDLGPRIWLRLG